MKAAIVDIFSLDTDLKLADFKPLNSDDFGINLRMIVGIQDGRGEESFDMIVCTPAWLKVHLKKEEMIFGRHFLIVLEFNYKRILDKLKAYVDSIESETWDLIGEKIGRIAHWEFEDYHEYKR